jgi:hypothetical protein
MTRLIVYTKGWQKHLAALREVFGRCRKYNTTLNLKKCEVV